MEVESSGGHGLVGVALPGHEGSSVRIKKGCDNEHVVGGGVWQGMVVGGAGCLPWMPSETTSSAPAEVPQQHTLQDCRLSCGGKEEATKATLMEAMTVVGMSLRWQLHKQALVGAMRAGGGRWRTR